MHTSADEDDPFNLEPLDIPDEGYEVPSRRQEYETERHPLAALILEGVAEEHPALRDWAQFVVPNLLSVLAFYDAKGMGATEAERFAAEKVDGGPDAEARRARIRKTMLEKDDQSLAVHTLNAALGAWTVVDLAGLDEHQRRLYLAGITMHDVNKMTRSEMRMQAGSWADYERMFRPWADRLGLWDFIDVRYWPDIAFLAHNAEDVRGENRTLLDFPRFQTDPGDLESLTGFVRLGDLLASVAQYPDDLNLMQRQDAVPDLILRLLGGRYGLRYHKTVDNRGLLTQVIHNAVLEKARTAGWVAFLYFPDGITYLAPRGAAAPELTELPTMVRQRLIDTVQSEIGTKVERDGKGLKWSDDYTQLLDAQPAGEVLVRRLLQIINEAKTPKAAERRAKLTLKPGAPPAAMLNLEMATTLDVDRTAEGLFGLAKLLEEYTERSRQECGEALLRALDQMNYLDAWTWIEYTGGVGYPWYYVAGHYLAENPGQSPAQLEELLHRTYKAALSELGAPQRRPPFDFLETYIASVLTLGGDVQEHDFEQDLVHYIHNKKLRKTLPSCAICNWSLGVRIEFSAFSNRKRVSYSVPTDRGICEVCAAEELLRSFTLGKTARGADGTLKFLHIYPSYYFTPLTGRVMARAYESLKNVIFQDVVKPFQKAGRDVRALLHADLFQVLQPPNPKRRLDRVAYPSGQMHGYYLLGVPYLGRDPTDTESWLMPALIALLLPPIFGIKVVVSSSSLPLHTSGADFHETVLLDSPHAYWQHAMRRSRFRLDELEVAIAAAMAVYGLTAEAFKDGSGFPVWNQLGSVARALDSDPLAIFGFADRIDTAQKGGGPVIATDGMAPFLAERLIQYYDALTRYQDHLKLGGKDQMGLIQGIVDRYAAFYRARGRAAYARLRPLGLAADALMDSPPELDRDSLQLQIEGRVSAMLDGVRDNTVEGWIPKGAYRDDEREPLVTEFARYMVDEVFQGYCGGSRANLRKRLNLLKNGCEAWYTKTYVLTRPEETTTEVKETV